MSLKRLLRMLRCDRGAAMVEFTLVAPILIFLTCGIIQFGYVFFLQNTMQNLARDGRFANKLWFARIRLTSILKQQADM